MMGVENLTNRQRVILERRGERNATSFPETRQALAAVVGGTGEQITDLRELTRVAPRGWLGGCMFDTYRLAIPFTPFTSSGPCSISEFRHLRRGEGRHRICPSSIKPCQQGVSI